MGAARLVVAKLGTSTLVDGSGALDHDFIRSLCDQVGELTQHMR